MAGWVGRSGVFPASVDVSFRARLCDTSDDLGEDYVASTAPKDLGYDESGSAGPKTYREPVAWWGKDGEPAQKAALDALARRIAEDHYGWLGRSQDLAYAGIVAWDQDGYADAVLWDYTRERCATRVLPEPLDADCTELHHDPPACPTPGTTSGTCSPQVGSPGLYAYTTSTVAARTGTPPGPIFPGSGTATIYRKTATGGFNADGSPRSLTFEPCSSGVLYNGGTATVASGRFVQIKLIEGDYHIDVDYCP